MVSEKANSADINGGAYKHRNKNPNAHSLWGKKKNGDDKDRDPT